MLRICCVCESDSGSLVYCLLSRAGITAAWRAGGAIKSRYVAAIEKYQGRSKRIRSWFWNGSRSRLGLSIFSEIAIRNSRRQEHGMDETHSRQENGLYGRSFRWGIQRGENDLFFVEGNPDAMGPAPKLVQEPVQRPSGNPPQHPIRTGVIREP